MRADDPHKSMHAALGRIPSGLFIVTLARPGVETGMLASWVQQCSFKPPLVSLAMQRGRAITELLPKGSKFTLNILESSQTDMIAHFGKGFAPNEDAFQGLDVTREQDQGPILTEALAYLVCQVNDRYPAGDHELFLAELIGGGVLDDGQPMIHVRKNGTHY
jgi:flavin reductase (DIM6/NTAB) family NADH-FMN oxidoreductase RutF